MRAFVIFTVLIVVGVNGKLRKFNGALVDVEEEQDLSKIPGNPGVDYPVYHSVPDTSFSCANVPFVPGMYANVETGCQAYHVCHDGREGDQGASFLCSNGTLFNQKEFSCDWWYNVDCSKAADDYRLNQYAETNPFVPKVKPEDAKLIQPPVVPVAAAPALYHNAPLPRPFALPVSATPIPAILHPTRF